MSHRPLGDDRELWAELFGLMGYSGRLAFRELSSRFATPLVARRAYRVVRGLHLTPQILVHRGPRRLGFEVRVMMPTNPPDAVAVIRGAPQAYLRGCFLAAGYMRDPGQEYHWEIRAQDQLMRDAVRDALEVLGVHYGWSSHRHGYLVYIKDRDQVEQVLTHLGAYRLTLALANIGVVKGMRNQVNRLVNSETANLKRTVASGIDQTRELQRLRQQPQWEGLDAGLRVVAELRLAHPDWSLREIGKACHPPLSKSAVNHRMRRLLAFTGKSPT